MGSAMLWRFADADLLETFQMHSVLSSSVQNEIRKGAQESSLF